ncbi:SpoIIE family protein phosphatase [Streptomyces aidingensis]|uniref:protein-serine/threonine phosphatase n=1 Tax=Streptomyces aidingensis TaxID=910347 RepID=A0A1I1TTR8_9ACTN|nr:SpoIIE family protein phosphatase [Streptomyces aidingensis]SFD62041.1 PAS domain S-box-containing protein [Streptomyces aidingensis]
MPDARGGSAGGTGEPGGAARTPPPVPSLHPSARHGEPQPRDARGGHRMRLNLLAAVDEDRRDAEVVLTALQQAVAGLNGLGGMVHLPGGGMAGALYMVVASGLPEPLTRPWLVIPVRGANPPGRAARRNTAVWRPEFGPPDPFPGREQAARWPVALTAGVGHLAVPVPVAPRRRGALSVLCAADDEPGPAGRALLTDVVAWMADRLRPSRAVGPSPALLRALEHGGTEDGPPEGLTAGPADVPSTGYTWDLRTGAITSDRPIAEVLTGIDPDVQRGGIEAWTELIHPDDLPRVLTGFDEGLRQRGGFQTEYRMRRHDGGYLWVESHARTVTDAAGEPVGVVGTLWDSTEVHAAAESVGRALRHMSDGFLALDSDWRIGFLNHAAERLLGSSGELGGALLWDVPAVRAVPGLEKRCRAAAAEGRPAGFDVPWPDGASWYHLRLVPVPGGLTLYITDITERRLRESERAAAERAASERSALVQRVTRGLAEAVTAQDVVRAVADGMLAPFGATGLVVMVVVGDRLAVVGSRGYPESFTELLNGQRVSEHTSAPAGEALRTRTAFFVSSPEEFRARWPKAAELIHKGGKQSWAFLPLAVSGREIGTAVISFDRPRVLEEDERTLLIALSGLSAQALDRARLYDETTTRARTLQRSLLPRVLPELPAVTAAARYQPAAQGEDVGGDWYDLIPLSADRVALVIGDVMGHGMAEAATMGRLRTAVRTLSELELPPDEVLGHLNEIVGELGEDALATCLYGVYDPVTRRLEYASAGHPPPAVAGPDSAVTFPSGIPDPPLGVAAPPFETVVTELPADSLLALYTDGLVESPGRDIDRGMELLAGTLSAAVAAGRAGSPGPAAPAGSAGKLEELCATVTSALLPAHGELLDDAALLLARTHPLPAESIAEWPLPEHPMAAGRARELVREQLTAWGLGREELIMTTELVVSELVGNVIRHARGPIRLRMLRSRTLICEVSDASLTTPHIRHASATDEGGRGLQLVAALSQRWGTRHNPSGKSIWTEQPLPGTAAPQGATAPGSG